MKILINLNIKDSSVIYLIVSFIKNIKITSQEISGMNASCSYSNLEFNKEKSMPCVSIYKILNDILLILVILSFFHSASWPLILEPNNMSLNPVSTT